jgi:transmembrane sensor
MRPVWPSFGTTSRSASRWFARLRADCANDRTDPTFRRWVTRYPRNELELERREFLWELLGELKDDPEMIELTSAAAIKIPRRRDSSHVRGRTWFRIGVPAALAVVLAALGLTLWRYLAVSAAPEVFATRIGDQKRIVLADGSVVLLNSDTRLYVRYTTHRRFLVLDKGEALFFVHHNPTRPFDVAAGGTVTQAVGTVFDVYDLPAKTTVSLLKGRVQVVAGFPRRRQSEVELSPGQAVAYTTQGGLGPIMGADLARIASWQAGRIEFDNVALRGAVEDFNRYSMTRIVIGDPSLGSIKVSGVLHFGDIDAFTRGLRGAFGIRSQHQGQFVVLLPPKSARRSEK